MIRKCFQNQHVDIKKKKKSDLISQRFLKIYIIKLLLNHCIYEQQKTREQVSTGASLDPSRNKCHSVEIASMPKCLMSWLQPNKYKRSREMKDI